MAVALVVGCHAFVFVDPKINTCVRSHYTPLLTPFANGDMGVDVFFVLSGFLIGYILLKECENHEGGIDTWAFIRNRFLRLWPALFAM